MRTAGCDDGTNGGCDISGDEVAQEGRLADRAEGVPRVTVVVPAKNEGRRIARCLEALRAQTLPPIEIILVDAHSRDDTVSVSMSYGAKVLYEEFGTRAGANQVGIDAARGDFIAFTDGDCVPDARWLETLAQSFEDGVVGVGGRIVNEGDSFWQQAVDVALDTFVGSANSVQGRPFADRRFVSSISGCNSMYRRTDLVAVGGFRTDLLTTEDTELNRRLLDRGNLLYVPEALVRHRHERGLRDFARRMRQYGYGRGQSLLLGPPLVVSVAAPVVLALAALRPWLAVLAVGVYAAALVGSALAAAWRHRRPALVAALPVIFVIEHACYALGFWKGLFAARLPRARRRTPVAEEPE
jgi:cellulose synthase/poly-beta-1,6-N-acetylglucosamine synthase-like glycosyltransferase